MSTQLLDRSPDLKKLRDEGYAVEVRSGFLLVGDIPYVTPTREIKRGTLISSLVLSGDKTAKPDTHVAHFEGECPCQKDGAPLHQIINQSGRFQLAGDVVASHMLSAKPPTPYVDYFQKMDLYATMLASQAQAIDKDVTPKNFHPIDGRNEDTVFNYLDSASSRAEIEHISKKLALDKVAIIGLGGTGSYILDLVAKTPVKEIHLFDGDTLFQHNAFRSPGAPSIDKLAESPKKVIYFKDLYSKMHKGIVTHEEYIDADNADQLKDMNFVFLCLDPGSVRQLIVEKLKGSDIPFIDVGMGVEIRDGSLGGILRVTTCTPLKHDHIKDRISFSSGEGGNDYASNIQIADLNALNAALAVIKWKKLYGFYMDLDHEHHSTYTIDGNMLLNEDKHET